MKPFTKTFADEFAALKSMVRVVKPFTTEHTHKKQRAYLARKKAAK